MIVGGAVRYGGPSALDCRWWGEVGGGDGPPLYDAALGRIEDGVNGMERKPFWDDV